MKKIIKPLSAAACPVAELERQILAAMDVQDAAERKLWDGRNSPHEEILEAEVNAAVDRRKAFQEMVTHVPASSKAGLVFQMTELRCAVGHLHDNLPSIEETGFGPDARAIERLLRLVEQAISNGVCVEHVSAA